MAAMRSSLGADPPFDLDTDLIGYLQGPQNKGLSTQSVMRGESPSNVAFTPRAKQMFVFC